MVASLFYLVVINMIFVPKILSYFHFSRWGEGEGRRRIKIKGKKNLLKVLLCIDCGMIGMDGMKQDDWKVDY